MSSHVYHELYLHLNWHTKDDQPLLTDSLEELTQGMIRTKCRAMKGVYLHEIGGTDTHIHAAISIEPFVTISDLVQELKGSSAFEVNKRTARKVLEWQRGYGDHKLREEQSSLGARLHQESARASCGRSDRESP